MLQILQSTLNDDPLAVWSQLFFSPEQKNWWAGNMKTLKGMMTDLDRWSSPLTCKLARAGKWRILLGPIDARSCARSFLLRLHVHTDPRGRPRWAFRRQVALRLWSPLHIHHDPPYAHRREGRCVVPHRRTSHRRTWRGKPSSLHRSVKGDVGLSVLHGRGRVLVRVLVQGVSKSEM